jgi:26S proteasome regulatory subunit N2
MIWLYKELELLDVLIKDSVDFVRQGALIAVAMILVQQNEASSPKVASIRKLYETVIGDKHEEAMAKFGAVLGQGIIDAGGRNATVSLTSTDGHCSMPAIVGMAPFTRYWCWYLLSTHPLFEFVACSYWIDQWKLGFMFSVYLIHVLDPKAYIYA